MYVCVSALTHHNIPTILHMCLYVFPFKHISIFQGFSNMCMHVFPHRHHNIPRHITISQLFYTCVCMCFRLCTSQYSMASDTCVCTCFRIDITIFQGLLHMCMYMLTNTHHNIPRPLHMCMYVFPHRHRNITRPFTHAYTNEWYTPMKLLHIQQITFSTILPKRTQLYV